MEEKNPRRLSLKQMRQKLVQMVKHRVDRQLDFYCQPIYFADPNAP